MDRQRKALQLIDNRRERLLKAPENLVLWYHNAVAVAVSAVTTPEVLRTIVLPAGLLKRDAALQLTCYFSMTNSANNKTCTVKFGGTTIYNQVFTAATAHRFCTTLSARNSVSSQVTGQGQAAQGGYGSTGAAKVTPAINTAADVNLTIEGTKALAGETLQLEYAFIELINFDAHTNKDWGLKTWH